KDWRTGNNGTARTICSAERQRTPRQVTAHRPHRVHRERLRTIRLADTLKLLNLFRPEHRAAALVLLRVGELPGPDRLGNTGAGFVPPKNRGPKDGFNGGLYRLTTFPVLWRFILG